MKYVFVLEDRDVDIIKKLHTESVCDKRLCESSFLLRLC